MGNKVKILETFRDGIQGLDTFIPTDVKVRVIRSLFNVGFDFIDIGSFVSPRFVPQFRDMEEVLEKVGPPPPGSSVFVLAASPSGASKACSMAGVDVIGFPFSTSESFLKKNIHADFSKARDVMRIIRDVTERAGKKMIVYLAMAFGNPYGDPVNGEIVLEWAAWLHEQGIRNIHLSDIIGVATPDQVGSYYHAIHEAFPEMELGIHLHVRGPAPDGNLLAAFNNGCTIFDGVISGLGGCPMTGYELLGNLPTRSILEFADRNNLHIGIDMEKFTAAERFAIDSLNNLA